jgi:hypothetical protein
MDLKRIITLTILLIVLRCTMAQDTLFSRRSIRAGIGVGINAGSVENGFGLLYEIGFQKSYGKKQRVRLNPDLILGGFSNMGITDVREQHYRITSLGFNCNVDILKYKAISLLGGAGIFFNYSRGLLGTGGRNSSGQGSNSSEYFNKVYAVGSLSGGIRINPRKSAVALELRPFNIQFGTDYFILGYFMLGLDFKIR